MLDPRQNLWRTFRFVDRLPQTCAAGDAVGEPRRELLHLADGVGEFFLDQHLEVGADHLVAIGLRGFVIECGTGSLIRSGWAKPGWVNVDSSFHMLARKSSRALLGLAGSETRPHMSTAGFDARRVILLDLPEDPRVRGGGAADHYRIASRLGDHGAGIFRAADVTVANDW